MNAAKTSMDLLRILRGALNILLIPITPKPIKCLATPGVKIDTVIPLNLKVFFWIPSPWVEIK